jgi:NADPH-dependent ferric siderophore reductase
VLKIANKGSLLMSDLTSGKDGGILTSNAPAPRRVRHAEARRRTLVVAGTEKISAHMTRVTFTGDLEGFKSLGFDDHVKIFLPDDGQGATIETPNLIGRDFTPRRHDPAANTLDIDFAIHDAGPASRWAAQAQPGQTLTLGGPRGSFIIPTSYDWHLLVGDETGLPAIGRRLAELPAGARAVVMIEIGASSDEIALPTQANATIVWVHRNDAEPGRTDVLAKTLAKLTFPKGDYYAWIACESVIAKELRQQLIAKHGANPKWVRASGYWRRGEAAIHEMHDGE